jgi:hypothetical protein
MISYTNDYNFKRLHWCRGGSSNPHGYCYPQDFKSYDTIFHILKISIIYLTNQTFKQTKLNRYFGDKRLVFEPSVSRVSAKT